MEMILLILLGAKPSPLQDRVALCHCKLGDRTLKLDIENFDRGKSLDKNR